MVATALKYILRVPGFVAALHCAFLCVMHMDVRMPRTQERKSGLRAFASTLLILSFSTSC
jgi:hypothetical protein